MFSSLEAFKNSRFNQILLTCSNVPTLNLSNLGVNDSRLKQLLENNQEAEWCKIWLSFNMITDESLIALLDFLSKRPGFLEELCLNNNRLSDKSTVQLCSCLSVYSSLTRLDLSFNLLTDQSLDALSGCLENTKIRLLNLQGIRATNAGLSSLAKATPRCIHLKIIKVSSNQISDEVLNYFGVWNYLTLLVITGKHISPEALKKVQERIEFMNCKNIEKLKSICSVLVVPRLGQASMIKCLPKQFCFKLGEYLFGEKETNNFFFLV